MGKTKEVKDYPSNVFSKQAIAGMGEVSRILPGGKFRILSPIYRRVDDRIMAGEGVKINEARLRRMQNEISEALEKGKTSPYYTEITERAMEGY